MTAPKEFADLKAENVAKFESAARDALEELLIYLPKLEGKRLAGLVFGVAYLTPEAPERDMPALSGTLYSVTVEVVTGGAEEALAMLAADLTAAVIE